MKNEYEIRGAITIIFVKRKNELYECIIDTSDLELVSSFPGTWNLFKGSTHEYVCGNVYANKRQMIMSMHRLICGLPEGLVVDHINHDTFDNRRENLRIISRSQNSQNRRGATRKSKSGIRGVWFWEARNKWVAEVTLNGKHKRIGYFDTSEEASKAVEEQRAILFPYSKEGENPTQTIPNQIVNLPFSPRKQADQVSGISGITWSKQHSKWIVRMPGRDRKYIGIYKSLEDAKHNLEIAHKKHSQK